MAGYGWNFTQFPKRPYNPSQIACRICNSVFTSTQALTDHIETHMIDDNSTPRRPIHGRNFTSRSRNHPYNLNPSPSSSSLPPTVLPFSKNSYTLPSFQNTMNNLQIASPRPIPPRPNLSLIGTRNRNYPSLGAQLQYSVALLQRKTIIEEPPHSDCTLPLIQLLDKPYSYEAEMKDDNSGNQSNDLDMLDLTLKL